MTGASEEGHTLTLALIETLEAEVRFWRRAAFAAMGVLIFSLFVRSATAATEDVWLTSGMWSRHNGQQEHHFRQNNSGFGIEYDQKGFYSVGAGYYRNSLDRDSYYAALEYTPVRVGEGNRFVGIGLTYTLVSGYMPYPIPAALPTLTVEYGDLGVNVYYVPTVVAAIQLKIKIK